MKLLTMLIALVGITCLAVAGFYLVTGSWKNTELGRRLVRPKKRSPLKDDTRMLRPAGHGLRQRVFDLQADFIFWSMLFVLAPYFAVATYVLGVSRNIALLILIFGPIITVSAVALRRIGSKLRSHRLGLDGELATAEELNQLMYYGYYVFHDLPATDKFNIDHVVIGSSGVYAVETKARSKRSRSGKNGSVVRQEGTVLRFPDYEDKKSVTQARDQAEWLSHFLSKSVGKSISATPVLALPGWWVERGQHDGSVLVYNPAKGEKLFTARRPVLDKQTVDQAVYQVEQRCRDLKPFDPA